MPTTTTEIYFTFSADPEGLTADDITVVGATKGVLSGTGLERTLTISNITVPNASEITVTIGSIDGYEITPTVRSVVVYVASSSSAALTSSDGLVMTSSDGHTFTATN